MADEKYECKTCKQFFNTLQACLRHELLRHLNLSRMSTKTLNSKKLHRLLDSMSSEDQPREKAHAALKSAKPGFELQQLFQIYCMDQDKLAHISAIVRSNLLKDLRNLHHIEVHMFGSIENGLMLNTSDIDIYVTLPSSNGLHQHQIYSRIIDLLRRGKHFKDVTHIPQARVPIIQCRHIGTGFKIDINCSCPDSVENTKFLREVLEFDLRLRSLMRFLKIWAKQFQLIGHGLMTCYCLALLVLFFLQQTDGETSAEPLMPSISKMQENEESHKVIHGVNYAYNLCKHMRPLPPTLQTRTLITRFFGFYHNFNFEQQMVAPFLGTPVPLCDFKLGKFMYEAYENQLKAVSHAHPLATERSMVVQDVFQLNHNVAKSVNGAHFKYFRKCVENAHRICRKFENENNNKHNDVQLYEALLFDLPTDTISETNKANEAAQTDHGPVTGETSALLHVLTPPSDKVNASQTNAQSTAATTEPRDNSGAVHRDWALHYVELILAVLTKIYCLHVKLHGGSAESDETDDHGNGNGDVNDSMLIEWTMNRLDEKGSAVWVMNGDIDMWSGRQYRRSSVQTFMKYQQALTKAFMLERRRMTHYAIDLNGRLVFHVADNYKTLKLELHPNESCIYEPNGGETLEKFFTNFQCIMQNLRQEE